MREKRVNTGCPCLPCDRPEGKVAILSWGRSKSEDSASMCTYGYYSITNSTKVESKPKEWNK